jgi:hypothetical protein
MQVFFYILYSDDTDMHTVMHCGRLNLKVFPSELDR